MGRRLVTTLLPTACAAYAVASLVWRQSWISGVAGGLIALLLASRHPRARFAAYIFFSAMAIRSVLTAAWPTLVFAVLAVLAMQTRAARTAWPRLRGGRVRARMPLP